MLLLFAACTSHPNGGGDVDTVPPPTTSEPITLVPLADIPTFVTFDPGWAEGWAFPVFEDFDGDGVVDLLTAVAGTGTNAGAGMDVIVRGPLDDVHLPSDAWVATDNQTLEAGEFTGDGHADLLVSFTVDGVPSLWLVPYPFDGSLEPVPGWIDLSYTLFDGDLGWALPLNGDDTLDWIQETFTELGDEQVEVTWGPVDRWSGPPNVTVTPFCRGGDNYGQFYAAALESTYFVGDLDGDRLEELFVPSYGSYDRVDCGEFLLSLPSSGLVDPFTSPRVVDRVSYLSQSPIGDWTGDGLPELWDALHRTVLLSPITIATGDSIQGASSVIPAYAIQSVTPTSYDLDGDGRSEAFARLTDDVLVMVPMDLDGLTAPQAATGWDLQDTTRTNTYVDRGHLWLVVIDPHFVASQWAATAYQRVDLGPVQ